MSKLGKVLSSSWTNIFQGKVNCFTISTGKKLKFLTQISPTWPGKLKATTEKFYSLIKSRFLSSRFFKHTVSSVCFRSKIQRPSSLWLSSSARFPALSLSWLFSVSVWFLYKLSVLYWTVHIYLVHETYSITSNISNWIWRSPN